MLSEPATKYPSYRAPREDGQALVVPTGARIGALLDDNRQLVASYEYDVQGRALAELAQSARQAVVERALRYTSAYRDVPASWRRPEFIRSQPLLVAGHQPELVHAGVWFKNFFLGRLAQRFNGCALQLIIDSDLCRSAAIRVPTGSLDAPLVEAVAYDSHLAEQPYEERRVDDTSLAASFAGRVAKAVKPFVADPLATELWPHVMNSLRSDDRLGLALARGRHVLEAAWGNETLELPVSQVCELTEFRWFASHVLAQLPRFHQAYNEALIDYRRAHGLRNRAQPLPNLASADGWLEAPFWIWTADRPVRRSLWARWTGNRVELSDRRQITFDLELAESGDAGRAVAQLAQLAAQGVKLRTRALLTTLFARLVVGDLFLHGIGGAKYDQVTDELAQRFFGFTPPGYLTVSATLRLPIDHESASRGQLRRVSQQLREQTFHPEACLTKPNEETVGIVAEKRRWIAAAKTPVNATQRHRAIVAANRALQPALAAQRQALLARQTELARLLRASAVLESREYAFCLFPARDLRRRLLDLTLPEA